MKNKTIAKIVLPLFAAAGLIGLAGCKQSDKVSNNIANEADNFKVVRRVVVLNTRTDKVEFVAQGVIAVDIDHDRLDIIAKVGKHKYKKDIINLTGNNMYTIEDISGSDVNSYKYEVTWLPQSVIPVEVQGEHESK